jgi:hypothetical protein
MVQFTFLQQYSFSVHRVAEIPVSPTALCVVAQTLELPIWMPLEAVRLLIT